MHTAEYHRTQQIVSAVAAASVPQRALDRMRQMFLAHETQGQAYLDDPETLRAYRAYFFLQTYFKALSVLRELPATYAHVWDLGSAMGPAAFAAWTLWPEAQLHLYDFSERALSDGATLGKALGARVHTHLHDLRKGLPVGSADLVIAANALSEIPFEQRVEACRALGNCVLIEPADKVHARDLQRLRDALLPRVPVAPCPHAAPCPALIRERDFCHQTRSVQWPDWHLKLQQAVGISDDRLRFSYLVYAGDAQPSRGVRIISNPLKDKGRMRFFGCAEQGLVEIIRQDKHASPANAAFDTWDRGALVSLPRADRVVKIGPDDTLDVSLAGESHRRGETDS